MTTSNGLMQTSEFATVRRGPLRLSMAEHPGASRLDGAWWPQSRDLAVELADLVNHVPPRFSRVVRVLLSPLEWDPAPSRVEVASGRVEVGSIPHDESHRIDLIMSDRSVLHVLVVPPEFTTAQGEEALLAAATHGNAHSATDLLAEVVDSPDVDPSGHWSDEGGSWWGLSRVPPSFRTGG